MGEPIQQNERLREAASSCVPVEGTIASNFHSFPDWDADFPNGPPISSTPQSLQALLIIACLLLSVGVLSGEQGAGVWVERHRTRPSIVCSWSRTSCCWAF